jgi:hypothetical protein
MVVKSTGPSKKMVGKRKYNILAAKHEISCR